MQRSRTEMCKRWANKKVVFEMLDGYLDTHNTISGYILNMFKTRLVYYKDLFQECGFNTSSEEYYDGVSDVTLNNSTELVSYIIKKKNFKILLKFEPNRITEEILRRWKYLLGQPEDCSKDYYSEFMDSITSFGMCGEKSCYKFCEIFHELMEGEPGFKERLSKITGAVPFDEIYLLNIYSIYLSNPEDKKLKQSLSTYLNSDRFIIKILISPDNDFSREIDTDIERCSNKLKELIEEDSKDNLKMKYSDPIKRRKFY